MSKSRACVCLLSIAAVFSSLGYAVTPDRISGAVTGGQTVTLRGNVHQKALPQFDQGPVDPAMPMGTMTLLAVPTAAQRKALTRLVAQQQDPKSSNYHRWLTPEQWADRFGMSQADLQQIAAWLKAQGFSMIQVARGRNWVSFTGTAAQVQSAFRTEIHRFNVNGELHYANATAPSIPSAIAGVITGIRGLHDFRPKPMGIKREFAARPYYKSSLWGDLAAPGDIATIYDINALYNSGITGAGQKLAVMGQTDIYLSDLNDFRSGFGLSQISTTNCSTTTAGVIQSPCNDPLLQYVLDGADPGLSTRGDISESDLDLEWAGAVARGAQLIFVNSTDTFTSFYYSIDNNLAPVISLSYGICEFGDNFVTDPTTGLPGPDELELMKANSLGITFVNSSGDSGAAECDNGSTLTTTGLATQGLAVSYPASSPEVTGVGGSAIALADLNNGANASTYWGTTTGTDGGSVLAPPAGPGYIPEVVWNDDLEIGQFCQANPSNTFCTSNGITNAQTAQAAIGISSGGGGVSNCSTQNTTFSACVSGFPQPSWQTVLVSGQTSGRFSPDVSFLATPNFPGYIFCTELSEMGLSGTGSGCAPGGSAGIVNALALTNSLGNPTPSIIGGTSVSVPVFAGMVALINQATGSIQGNINPLLYQLAATAPTSFHDITTGDIKVYCQAGTPAGQPTALQCPSTGVFGFSAGTGFDLASGLGSVDVSNLAAAAVNPPDFSASSPTNSLNLNVGQSGTATITVTPINSFTGPVSFACALTTGVTASCSFNPSTVTPPGTTQTTATILAGNTGGSGTLTITATTGVLSYVSHQAASIALTVVQPDFSLTAAPTSGSVVAGHTTSPPSTVTVTPINGFNQTITFSCTGLPTGATCAFNPPTVTPNGTNSATTSMTISTAASMAAASGASVTINASGSGVSHTSTYALTVTTPTDQSFSLAPGAATYSVTQGSSINNATVTLTGTNGFNTPVTYTCSDPASESTCTATATSTGATFLITTMAPSMAANQPLGHGARIFYAALLPGLLGIMLTVGSRKRSLRGMRLLGLIVALGFSTLWLASCGGSSGGTKNPGTPKGAYTITVNATTGGANPVTGSTTFTLQVN